MAAQDTDTDIGVKLAVLTERIEAQSVTLGRIETRQLESERTRNDFREQYALEKSSQDARILANETALKSHETNDLPKCRTVDDLVEDVKEVREVINPVKWISLTSGVVVTGWFINQILGLIK